MQLDSNPHVRKRALNHLAKLFVSVRLRTEWFWVRVQLQLFFNSSHGLTGWRNVITCSVFRALNIDTESNTKYLLPLNGFFPFYFLNFQFIHTVIITQLNSHSVLSLNLQFLEQVHCFLTIFKLIINFFPQD